MRKEKRKSEFEISKSDLYKRFDVTGQEQQEYKKDLISLAEKNYIELSGKKGLIKNSKEFTNAGYIIKIKLNNILIKGYIRGNNDISYPVHIDLYKKLKENKPKFSKRTCRYIEVNWLYHQYHREASQRFFSDKDKNDLLNFYGLSSYIKERKKTVLNELLNKDSRLFFDIYFGLEFTQ